MGKLGIEWVKSYGTRAPTLAHTEAQARGFYDCLSGTRVFNRGGSYAHDLDFEQEGQSGAAPAGRDTEWVERVDIVYFAGHGLREGPVFSNARFDDGTARSTEIRWGGSGLKWVVLDACFCLAENAVGLSPAVVQRWGPSFQGLHYLLGFRTAANDEGERGTYFADYLNEGYPVSEAWRMACEETDDGARWAYLQALSPGADTTDDHWVGRGFVSEDPTGPLTFRYVSRTLSHHITVE